MDDINELISKHLEDSLPERVGTELRRRLDRCDELEKLVKKLERAAKKLEDGNVELAAEVEKLESEKTALQLTIDGVQPKLEEAGEAKRIAENLTIELQTREKMITLREEHADEKVALIRGVVGDVFANNRFKYHTHTSQDVWQPEDRPSSNRPDGSWDSGYVPIQVQQHRDETVEGEG